LFSIPISQFFVGKFSAAHPTTVDMAAGGKPAGKHHHLMAKACAQPKVAASWHLDSFRLICFMGFAQTIPRALMAKKARTRRPVSKRRTTITIQGRPTRRAERMTDGRYRLVAVKGGRVFVGTLIDTINKGRVRLAIFSVPKG
jgi:hypothetical protein